MIGGAGFSADGNKGASTKGHFTFLQLKTSNHLTIHVVHTRVPYMVAPMAGTGAPDRSGIAADPV